MGDFINLQSFGMSTLCKNDKFDAMGMITPVNIVKDMVDLLPDNVWNKNTKFLDITCKSGNFLREIYFRLMECEDLKEYKPNKEDRSEYIRKNQIYGICMNTSDKYISARNVFGYLPDEYNIEYINNWLDAVKHTDNKNKLNITFMKDKIQEAFGENMKFNVIVGNPPYNNDIYLDFVTKSKALGAEHICMITPAKWQAKGGDKNERFRKDIVPYMYDIVYYDKPTDVFPGTSMCGDGISYYCIGNAKSSSVNINRETFHNWEPRYGLDKTNIGLVSRMHDKRIIESGLDYKTPSKSYFTAKNFGDVSEDITSKYKMHSSARCIQVPESAFKHTENMDKYKVYIGHFITSNPVIHILEPNVASVRESCLLGFGTLEECESIKSYYQTKLIWYLVYMTNCGNAGPEAFINVPDPGAFDHIFTDEELYEKYNLTEEEIAIIESTIKERK